MKSINDLFAAIAMSAAMMPERPSGPKRFKGSSSKKSTMSPKKYRLRKARMKMQKQSRKINRTN